MPKPKPLGEDRTGRKVEDYSLEEYKTYEERKAEILHLNTLSRRFKRRVREQPEWETAAKKEEARKEREKVYLIFYFSHLIFLSLSLSPSLS